MCVFCMVFWGAHIALGNPSSLQEPGEQIALLHTSPTLLIHRTPLSSALPSDSGSPFNPGKEQASADWWWRRHRGPA